MISNYHNRQQDRFIPHRASPHYNQLNTSLSFAKNIPYSTYNHMIKRQLFCNPNDKVNIFYQNQRQQSEWQFEKPPEQLKKINSHIQSPAKILDAPKYRDDFYLNNIDWMKEGPLGIALDNEVFIYTPQNIKEIGRSHFNSYVSGIKIQQSMMAVGLSNGIVQLYDIDRGTIIRSLNSHNNRVSSLAFLNNTLLTGSKDKSILVNDLRGKNNVVKQFNAHNGQICTIKVKNRNQNIFATGSTDGSAIVWDLKFGKIDQFKGHKGAVKALDWCPWKNGLLATGGGNLEQKSIKIWNTVNSKLIASEQIYKQISSLIWNQQYKCLTTSNHDEINIWNMKSIQNSFKLQIRHSFKAHSRRILNLAQSHDQNYVCSIGADESMKFWKFSPQNSNPFSYQQKNTEKPFFYRV